MFSISVIIIIILIMIINKNYFKLSYLGVNAGQMEMTKTLRSQWLPLINGRLSG